MRPAIIGPGFDVILNKEVLIKQMQEVAETSETESLSQRFIRFADEECIGSSELYEVLSRSIAEDDALLSITSKTRREQPVPNMLFGAVHYLLQKTDSDELARFYPDLTHHPEPPADAFAPFRQFCIGHEHEITALLSTNLVQTNAVRRCAYLYPVFCRVSEISESLPLAIVEIGTSAGLQLCFDQYFYRIDDELTYGYPDSALEISSSFRGNKVPTHLDVPPTVQRRIGVDLNIIDLADEEDEAWLHALIWPEHHERRAYLDKAIEITKEMNLELVEGDGTELLPSIVESIEDCLALCVFHTHTANQFTKKQKDSLLANVDRIGRQRDIFHVHNNIEPHLHMTYYKDKKRIDTPLAHTHGHAQWIEWL